MWCISFFCPTEKQMESFCDRLCPDGAWLPTCHSSFFCRQYHGCQWERLLGLGYSKWPVTSSEPETWGHFYVILCFIKSHIHSLKGTIRSSILALSYLRLFNLTHPSACEARNLCLACTCLPGRHPVWTWRYQETDDPSLHWVVHFKG